MVVRTTGIAASTIGRGLKELASADTLDVGRVRRRGGGCKPLVKKDATLLADLLALVDPSERGDPMSPLRWTCKSLSQLAAALAAKGHRADYDEAARVKRYDVARDSGMMPPTVTE